MGEDGQVVASQTVPSRDAYVVCREPVAEAVAGFVADWTRRHPPDGGRHAPKQTRVEVSQVRAYEYLAQRTRVLDRVYGQGVSEDALSNMFRRVRGGGPLRNQTIELRVADMLLTALDRQGEIPHDGVEGGDPRLTPQRRGSRVCCTGLTGTVSPPPL